MGIDLDFQKALDNVLYTRLQRKVLAHWVGGNGLMWIEEQQIKSSK